MDERRRPLGAARRILQSLEERHDLPLVSRHVNPLASAYNRLGLHHEASLVYSIVQYHHLLPPALLNYLFIPSLL